MGKSKDTERMVTIQIVEPFQIRTLQKFGRGLFQACDACLRSADSAIISYINMAGDESPLRASAPTAGYTFNNRSR